MRVEHVLGFVGFILLDIHTQSGARSACSGKTVNDSAAIVENQANALDGRGGFVDGVIIGKVIGRLYAILANTRGQAVAQGLHQLVGGTPRSLLHSRGGCRSCGHIRSNVR